jgi:WD40 repeat protein
MKILFISLLFISAFLNASVIKPFLEIKVKGSAQDIVLDKDDIIIVTDGGYLIRYDTQNKKILKEIHLPQIKDFMGDNIDAKIFSVDYLDGRYIFLSDSGIGGYSNLWVHENNKTKRVIDPSYKGAIIKAKFIDKDHVLLGFLSNEAALFDLKNRKELYRVQLNPSKFSDFDLSDDKTKAAFGCESGVITIIDTKTGKVLKELKGINKDNVYKVSFVKNIVTGAGQDRRGSIYDVNSGRGDFIEGNFLIYATGISPSGKRVAFAMDENNDISVYDLSTKSKLFTLKGQKSTLNSIVFKDEDTIFSASDDDTVMMWKLK